MSSSGSYPQQQGYGQQPTAGPPGYGQQSGYPQPYGFGGGPAPVRPAVVTTAAVLGFILGALATAAAIFAFVGRSAVVGQDDGGTGLAGALSGNFLVFALIALTIAVLLIWGSVLAITGRSRVLLIVGAALLAALGLISFFGSIGNDATDTGGIIGQLVGLAAALLILVFLSLAPAARYFAAHRDRRGR